MVGRGGGGERGGVDLGGGGVRGLRRWMMMIMRGGGK